MLTGRNADKLPKPACYKIFSSERRSHGAGGGKALRFQRSKRDRWLFGVCGGLARQQGWNSNVVRLVTAVLAIAIPGFSLVPVLAVYLILAAVLPESDAF